MSNQSKTILNLLIPTLNDQKFVLKADVSYSKGSGFNCYVNVFAISDSCESCEPFSMSWFKVMDCARYSEKRLQEACQKVGKELGENLEKAKNQALAKNQNFIASYK